MPFFLIILLLQVLFVIHAVKTGRVVPWAYVIMLIPVAGTIAYILIELVPELLGTAKGQRAQRQVIKAINPERRYRELGNQLEVSDTVATRAALADECLTLGKFEEAELHFDEILARPMGDEPHFMLGRARAEFGVGAPEKAVATLEELRKRWPDYQSADGHLLYARALHEANRHDEALAEFEAVSSYYPGAEARVRWAMLLDAMGRRDEARTLFRDTLAKLKHAPSYVRQAQAEWISIAEREMRR